VPGMLGVACTRSIPDLGCSTSPASRVSRDGHNHARLRSSDNPTGQSDRGEVTCVHREAGRQTTARTGRACQTHVVSCVPSLPDPLRRELLDYLLGTSSERAEMIAKLVERSPGMAALLMDLEADDDLRSQLEMTLLNR
jgi:hypothetical protein